jgi:putative flippase GtrA
MKLFVNKSMVRQFTLYALMGGMATGVDWLSFYSLNIIGGVSYLVAVILSFSLGAMINYLLNRFITFKDQTRQIIAQIGVYSFICALSLLGSIILMYVLVEQVRLWSMAARMVTSGIMLVLNFLVHKFITYNQQIYARFTNLHR